MGNNTSSNLELIKKKEKCEFSYNDIEMYNDIFKELREKKVIKNRAFSDSVWILDKKYNITGYVNNINFQMKETLSDYILIVKCLLLSKLGLEDNKAEPDTLVSRYKYLLTIINITDGFKNDKIEQFQDYCDKISHKSTVVERSLIALNELDIFYELDYIDEFITILEEKFDSDASNRPRRLPNYKSVLLFNSKINEIFKYLSYEEKKMFYPLYLWWNITMIIPLRPSEFLTIKYDCCWKDGEGRFWITVPRSKVDDKKSKIKLVYDLEINKNMYDMINEYKDFISNEFDSGEYLVSYEVRKSCFSNISKYSSEKTRIDREKLNADDGNVIIRDFYEKFLKHELKSGIIQYIRMGDTRHYAFCNMLIQGLNPLSIAQIGGHTSLKSQMHYYQQLEECTNAYVSELSYKINLRKHKIYHSVNDYNSMEYKSRTMLGLYSKEEIKDFLEIDHGLCIKYKNKSDKINFSTCREECYDCEYHIMNFEKYPFMKEKIINKATKAEAMIKKQLELIRELSDNIRNSIREEQVDNISNKKLRSIGVELNSNLNKRAVLQSSLLDFVIKEA